MSEQERVYAFTVEDVESAQFAYGVQQCFEPGDTPQGYIKLTWPEYSAETYAALGVEPLQPRLLAQYERGAALLEQAELVHCRAFEEITPADYAQLGQVDSPIWIEDKGRQGVRRRGHRVERDLRLFLLWALRLPAASAGAQ